MSCLDSRQPLPMPSPGLFLMPRISCLELRHPGLGKSLMRASHIPCTPCSAAGESLGLPGSGLNLGASAPLGQLRATFSQDGCVHGRCAKGAGGAVPLRPCCGGVRVTCTHACTQGQRSQEDKSWHQLASRAELPASGWGRDAPAGLEPPWEEHQSLRVLSSHCSPSDLGGYFGIRRQASPCCTGKLQL